MHQILIRKVHVFAQTQTIYMFSKWKLLIENNTFNLYTGTHFDIQLDNM